MAPLSERREQIRDAALRVFARQGYQETVVEDVAKEAGVSKGTIYTYFDRKEELLGAVYRGLLEEIQSRRTQILKSDLPPLKKLREMLHAFVGIVGSREQFAQVLLDIWVAGLRTPNRFDIPFSEAYAESRQIISQLLQQAQERGDVPDDLPDIAATVVIGAVDGVLLQWLLDPEKVAFTKATDDILDVLYRGIKASTDS